MTNLLDVIYRYNQPKFSYMSGYVNMTFGQLISQYADYNVITHSKNGEAVLLLEIRTGNSTLSCIIKDYICIEAYKFPD